MRAIRDWNGVEISLGESRGSGVLAFTEPLAGLLRGEVQDWPPPEILPKLKKSGRQGAFEGEDLNAVVKMLGFYCDLQSVHSEDAITWSVFGPLIYATEKIRAGFCTQLFQLIEPSLSPPKSVTIFLWHRVRHPDTCTCSGPEIDFLLETPEVVIVGEAKWLSSVGTHQGTSKKKSQIELRKEYLEKFGRSDYPTVKTFVVLVISLNEHVKLQQDCQVGDAEILFRNVSWESVCNIKPHPAEEELLNYYKWKKVNSK